MRFVKTITQSIVLSLLVGVLVAVIAQVWGLGQLSALLLISVGVALAGVPALLGEARASEHRRTRAR